MKRLGFLSFLAAAAFLSGCSSQLETITVPSAGTVPATDNGPLTIRPDAGRRLNTDTAAAVPGAATPGAAAADPDIFAIARTMSFASRRDPFSLLSGEVSFDREQTAARILAESGGFRQDFEPQPEVEEEQVAQPVPVPDWRVAGIVISDSVLALIDTGAGVFDVRPGQTVPQTDWVVISIDEESVLLRNRNNVTPREHRVLLAAQLLTAPTGGGAAGGGFGPAGGAAGGPPGGFGGGGPAGRGAGAGAGVDDK